MISGAVIINISNDCINLYDKGYMNIDFTELIKTKSTDDLINIYVHPWNYQEEYVSLAEKELLSRNVDLSGIEKEKEYQAEVLDEALSTGRPGNKYVIILGFISAILGGFLGIIIGLVYSTSKHKIDLPDKYYVYDQQTRDKGTIMVAIGIIVIIFSFVYRLY